MTDEIWHKFDPSDETTWPKYGFYYVAHEEGVFVQKWIAGAWEQLGNQLVTAWQPIPIPSPPPSEHGPHGRGCCFCDHDPNPQPHERGDS